MTTSYPVPPSPTLCPTHPHPFPSPSFYNNTSTTTPAGVCYVNHKLRTYIEGVTDCFEGVGNDDRGPLNRWGRGRVPPQPWRRLRELGAPAMIDVRGGRCCRRRCVLIVG